MVSGHENIVDFYGAYYHQAPRTPSLPEGLWIATEFITGATLQDLIGTRKTLGERWISYICKQIITGLFHMQKKNVIHHDIKPGNILITSLGEVKIGEFGFATFGGKSSSTFGTITYSAPEVLANFASNKLEYDHKERRFPFLHFRVPAERPIQKTACKATSVAPLHWRDLG
ncbi:serine/threonine-protein kinase mig-15-like [Xenopus tropicalis]|uniref:Serine/threonine-protein kinase mig-15-like n=1 Tax=Xenopus tropicalis TaxID=8364 RepID=A0A8J1IUD4_XENTR|nr:serine/threonine-protein kinase mig-15-like [Xenopus tropicalis]XP_031749212.1 serine/threonine-protein kinase mig-15-like [Xenopus tropicalis]